MNLFVNFRSQLLLLIAVSLFAPTFFVQAQSESSTLKVNVMPAHPGPYQTVTISVEDFSRDLNKVEMLWSVNGEVVTSGIGLKKIQVKTGAIGSATKVTMNMGGSVEEVVLRPSVTDLLWQADTFTPPFYKGKALHSAQDPIIVMSEPFIVTSNGTRLDPDELIYKWMIDGKVNASASGHGKKTFSITPSILQKPINVSVVVSSTDGAYSSEAAINIPTSAPEIVFYENHPLFGIEFGKALNEGDFTIHDSEANIIAEPFFFSNEQRTTNFLSYRWNLNDSTVDQDGEEIVVRKPEGQGSGRSSISLEVKNLDRFMQTATAKMHAIYNNDGSNTNTQTVF